MSRQALNSWVGRFHRRRYLLQDDDHSRNDPRLFPGFPRSCSGMFPERFRIVPGIADSEEIRPD